MTRIVSSGSDGSGPKTGHLDSRRGTWTRDGAPRLALRGHLHSRRGTQTRAPSLLRVRLRAAGWQRTGHLDSRLRGT